MDDAPSATLAGHGAAQPLEWIGGLPVHRFGQAPKHLRTRTQLERGMRLRPGVPVCLVKPYMHPDERVFLYDPAEATPIPFRSAGDEWAWWARRTCPRCGQRREYVVHGKQCGKCHKADRAKAEQRTQRTCSQCRRVGSKPYPLFSEAAWHQVRLCRSCVAAKNREKERLLRAAIRCPGGCGRRTATKKEVLAWALKNYRAISRWERRCPPCEAAHQAEQERVEAERQARWEKARAEQAERDRQAREARAAEVADLEAWAREILTDGDVVILDTETTGLHDEARIVDIAVTTVAGETLLDTLVNPGEPIPASATDIHGITDEMVAGAPTFAEVLPLLADAVAGRRVLIYNRSYDVARLRHELALLDLDADAWLAAARWEDAMIPYSDWVGEWNDWHGNYRWQPLGGGHRALGDCLAVIDCLKAMARTTCTRDSSDEPDRQTRRGHHTRAATMATRRRT